VEYESFTVFMKEGAFHCCDSVGCRFHEGLDRWKYVFWYERIPRICLGVVMLH